MHVIDEGTTYLVGEGEKLTFMKPPSHGEATNEEIINVLLHRLMWLNSLHPCDENELALKALAEALTALEARQTRESSENGAEIALGVHSLADPEPTIVADAQNAETSVANASHLPDAFKVEKSQ